MDHDTLGYKCTLIHSHFYRGYTGLRQLSYNRVSHRYTVGILCYMRIHWDTNGALGYKMDTWVYTYNQYFSYNTVL